MIALPGVEESGPARLASVPQDMNVEKTIAEIELLEHMLSLPDPRRLQMADWKAANQKHDETYAANPWFRLWKRYGV